MCKFFKESGNATIEYMLIVSLIAGVLISTIYSVSSSVKRTFIVSECSMNCSIINSKYETYLSYKGIKHTENLYSQFIDSYSDEVCPENFEVIYSNGKVVCSGHSKGLQKDEGNEINEPVPFL